MKTKLLLFAFISLFIFISCSSNGQDAKTHFEKGVSFYENKEYEEAKQEFDKAIELKPDYYQAWNNKGVVAVSSYLIYTFVDGSAFVYDDNWLEKAIECFDKVIELKPDYYQAWNNKGSYHSGSTDYEEAIKCFDRAIELNPDNTEIWNNKGNAFVGLRRYEEAIKCFDRAIELNNNNYLAWYNKGMSLFINYNYKHEKAIECFDRVIETSPQNIIKLCPIWGVLISILAFDYKGCCLEELEKYKEAIKNYDKAIKLHPYWSRFWKGKANSFLKLGKEKEANIYFDKLKELGDADSWFKTGGFDKLLLDY